MLNSPQKTEITGGILRFVHALKRSARRSKRESAWTHTMIARLPIVEYNRETSKYGVEIRR